MTPTKPCSIGPRHAWMWVKNVTNSQIGGRSASFTLRGLYRCACGAKKIGAPNHDGPGLLGVIADNSRAKTKEAP